MLRRRNVLHEAPHATTATSAERVPSTYCYLGTKMVLKKIIWMTPTGIFTPGGCFIEVDHQVRSNLQVLGFLRRETKIEENVSA